MKELIRILEIAANIHGPKRQLTIGHLLNIARMAECNRLQRQEIVAIKEQNEHLEILEQINPLGQD